MITLSPHGSKLLGAIQRNFALLDDHAKLHPAEVDLVLAAMISHIRSWRPSALRDSLDTALVVKLEASTR